MDMMTSMLMLGSIVGVLVGVIWCNRAGRRELKLQAIGLGLMGGFIGGFQGAMAHAFSETTIAAGVLFGIMLSIGFSFAFLRHLFRRE